MTCWLKAVDNACVEIVQSINERFKAFQAREREKTEEAEAVQRQIAEANAAYLRALIAGQQP